MTDYQELYLKMFRANEQAIKILIAAQKECEELYIISSESEEAEPPVMKSETFEEQKA